MYTNKHMYYVVNGRTLLLSGFVLPESVPYMQRCVEFCRLPHLSLLMLLHAATPYGTAACCGLVLMAAAAAAAPA